ncbi:phage tail length tape measure family protein [Achromobacter ruhlandii]|uniref:phage tail length tape measure family protein n=1 Tax=Achromobacter ruhlandii TaxID=72557 RepID=UPI0021F1D3E6|nr:phage tail length tape measure family protein [Achromobacter ruhlandii]MCV6795769.1 phage tail length tape measure family protein [Achromobacter ruhlandii]MCV6807741.1 phage tail length tape measure family protein [Achromobacter ruhlandii]MCV6818082.1 phage tail length tape measure family protein [Achromobacter ruhlandii]
MTDELTRSVIRVDGDASGLTAAMAEVTQETGKAKKSLAALGRDASQGMTKAAEEGSQAGRKLERATQSLVNQIERQIAVTGAGARGTASYYVELAKQRGIDANQLKPYLDQLEAVTRKQAEAKAAIQATAPAVEQMGMSAKATAAAMRGLPAQFTDIIVSLQGGQRPMTVLMQQGGQLKDMFGGLGPAARAMGSYIAGLVNPFTLAAGAVAFLGTAYLKGVDESQAFNRTVIQTGGVAGVTAGQLQDMARRAGDVVGTQGKAADALNLFASSAKVGAENMEQFTAASVRWEKVTGAAVADTVQNFIELGKSPLEAALKLNEGMNFLTATTYEQIRALERQGKTAEAASVAQRAYADALNDRAPKLSQNLGLLERAWKGVSETARGAWDSMLDIGRAGTLEERIAKQAATVQALESKLQARLARGGATGNMADLIKAAATEQERLEREYFEAQGKAQVERDRRKALDQTQFRADYLEDDSRNTKPQQRQRAIEKEAAAFRRAVEGLKEGTDEYRRVYAAHKVKLADIDKQFEDKDAGKGPSGAESEIARLRARIAEEKALAVELDQRGLHTSKLNEYERRSAEIGELLKGNLKSQVRASLERTKALATEAGALMRANAETKAFQESREKYFASLEDGVAKIAQEAQGVEDQIATYGMSKAALEQLTIARLEERKAALQGFDGSEREVELIEKEIDARKRLGAAIRQKDIKDAQKKATDEMARDWERTVDKYGDVFRQGFADMMNNGKDGWKSFTKSLVTTFKTTVADQIYRMFAQPFVATIVGNLAGVMGGNAGGGVLGGAAGAQGAVGGGLSLMNALSVARTAYSALTGGFTATLASGISSIGSAIGSSAAQHFALGMTGQGASLAAGLAGPTTAGSSAAAAGSMMASAIPVAGWIAAGMMVNRSLFRAGWDPGNGTMAPIAKYNPITGPSLWTDKALRAVGVSGEWASMLSGSAIIARAFGRGPKQYGDTTMVGDFNSLGFNGYTSTPWKQKGGWFRSNRNGTQIGALDNDFLSDVGAAFEQMKTNAAGLAEAVGVSASSLATYSDQFRIKLTKDQEENQKLLDEALANIGENMVRSLVPNIADFSKENETASATLQRLGANLGAANRALKLLDLKLYDVSVSGAATASKLVDAFGSIDAMSQATAQYYQLYYSEAERAKLSLADMADSLKGVNMALPNTMEELRGMVSALDLTTDAGRKAYVALLAIAPEFAAVMEATTRRGQEAAGKLLEAFTGRGALAGALDGAALKALLLADSLTQVGTSTGQISRLFLDLDSGLLDFSVSNTRLDGSLSGAQEASLSLLDQMEVLRSTIGGTVIDFAGLAGALEKVDTDVFVATLTAAFEQLATRMRSLLDSIANERIAVRQAAQQVLDPGAMSPEAIRKGIQEIATALPSNAGLVAAGAQLNYADSVLAQKLSARNAAEQSYNSVKASHDTATGNLDAAQQRASDAQAWLDKLNWDIYAPKTVPYKKKNWKELDAARSVAQAQLPAAQQALAQAQAALAAAQAAAAAAPSAAEVSRLQAAYASAVTEAASAQAVATEAANKARTEQTAYADALQKFALDASKSVGKLGELRAETLRYYEAQKALANLLAEGAKGLRKTVKDYRVSQLSPEDQFANLQADYAKAYAKAMGADGEELAGYADELNNLMLPMLEAAKGAFSSDEQYQAFIATALARAEAVAGRMDAVAPKDYQKQSLDLLAEIDAKLLELEKSALSGDQVLTNAINAARDATVNGLRQVVNALTGRAVAAFAKGGFHTGGLRLVGENGPELEVTGPSRIFNADQTRAILAGGDDSQMLVLLRALLQEQQRLREEVENLRIEARATASNTGKTARQLDRIEADGLVVRPDGVEALRVEVTNG